MALDRKKIQKILETMGYIVEFDSDTPGVVVNEEIISWSHVPTIIDCNKEASLRTFVKLSTNVHENLNFGKQENLNNHFFDMGLNYDIPLAA